MTILLWYHWLIFIGINFITFLSYSWISYRLFKKRKKSNTPLLGSDSFLFEGFVFTCGIHHLVHPFAMFWMANVMKASMGSMMVMSIPVLFWYIFLTMIVVDSIMMGFSVLSAKFLKLE